MVSTCHRRGHAAPLGLSWYTVHADPAEPAVAAEPARPTPSMPPPSHRGRGHQSARPGPTNGSRPDRRGPLGSSPHPARLQRVAPAQSFRTGGGSARRSGRRRALLPDRLDGLHRLAGGRAATRRRWRRPASRTRPAASERLRATPLSTRVSSTSRSGWQSRVITGTERFGEETWAVVPRSRLPRRCSSRRGAVPRGRWPSVVAGLLTEPGDPSRLGRGPGHLVVPGRGPRAREPSRRSRISSRSTVTEGADSNQPSGSRPASQPLRPSVGGFSSTAPRWRAGRPGRVGADPPAPKTPARRSPSVPCRFSCTSVATDYIITLPSFITLLRPPEGRASTTGGNGSGTHDPPPAGPAGGPAGGLRGRAPRPAPLRPARLQEEPVVARPDLMTVTGRSPGSNRASSSWSRRG